eukprot:GDKI01020727.1.p1 GENE.GDKI01020727.1~~GDKI01020727.1.p1  ORF type:complete len:388 (-),score=165.22 GDKI01020727.1:764-1927(-)
MDASMYQNLHPQAQQATGLKFSSIVRLSLAAAAVLGLTYTGVNYVRGTAVPTLKATHALYEAGEYSAPEALLAQHFAGFMDKFGKNYPTAEEMALRFEIFKDNTRFVKEQNAAGNAYVLGENEYMDLTHEEFTRNYLGLDRGFFQSYGKEGDIDESLLKVDKKDLPPSLDWREKGCITDVKNQGQCGSCWAFSATGALEGAACAAGLPLTNLSEQHLVDCATKEGNMGCSGGEMQLAFQYVQRNGGLCSETDYPYKAVNGQCKASSCENVFEIEGYRAVPQDDEKAFMEALAKYGPVAIAIEADQMEFQFYSGGVFDAECGDNLDHGVLAVGYGTDAESGLDYYLVKNSWGNRWGDKGFIKLVRAKGPHGQCGMLLDASYPLVAPKA